MTEARTLNELLRAFNLNLAMLKDCGLRGFDCKPETLQKLERLGQMAAERPKAPLAAKRLENTAAAKTEAREAAETVIRPRAVPSVALAENFARTAETLEDIRKDLGDCKRCGLCQDRHNIVFGAGAPNARLMFVGEGPGYDEDMQGLPFVGAAGQLLTKIIDAMKLTREDVYICNVVKCRPPGNRNPAEAEIRACIPFLERQIAAVKPAFIVGLGSVAVQSLLNTTKGISKIRGQWTTYQGIKFMPTFHPSYLLRSPEKKREVWQDMQQIMALYPYA